MTTVTIEEAQAKLPQIIEGLQPGEEFTITDHGEPLGQVKKAEPLPKPGLRPAPGLGKGMITILAEDDEHLKDFAEYMPVRLLLDTHAMYWYSSDSQQIVNKAWNLAQVLRDDVPKRRAFQLFQIGTFGIGGGAKA